MDVDFRKDARLAWALFALKAFDDALRGFAEESTWLALLSLVAFAGATLFAVRAHLAIRRTTQ